MAVDIKSPTDIEAMRRTCQLAAKVLDFIAPEVKPGVTTLSLDQKCHAFILDHGAIPAPLNYRGFPKSICTSVNDVICHGIPGPEVLEEGDIINIDITTILDGYFGDTSEMFEVGEVSSEAQKLIQDTRRSMWLGIQQVQPGHRVGDIGAAIYAFAHEEHGYGVVEDFCGHGIGKAFHMAPPIPHFNQPGAGRGLRLRPGMTFTIEPMINQGTPKHDLMDDGWTARTQDRKLSAQCEHTILVTPSGYEVLTMRESAWKPEGAAASC